MVLREEHSFLRHHPIAHASALRANPCTQEQCYFSARYQTGMDGPLARPPEFHRGPPENGLSPPWASKVPTLRTTDPEVGSMQARIREGLEGANSTIDLYFRFQGRKASLSASKTRDFMTSTRVLFEFALRSESFCQITRSRNRLEGGGANVFQESTHPNRRQ